MVYNIGFIVYSKCIYSVYYYFIAFIEKLIGQFGKD